MIDIDKAWETAKERPADAIGLAVTSLFVVGSTITELQFAWDESGSMPRLLVGGLMAVILAGALYKALYFPLTWKRGRWFSALCGLPILAVCIAYSLTANNKTMERYFGKHEFATVVESAGYKVAKADVDELKDRLAPLAKARPTGKIQAELEGKLAAPGLGGCTGEMDDWRKRTYCPDIAKLRAELADGAERDKLEARLAVARTKLDAYEGQTPKATSSLGPITPAFAALGLVVTTPQEALAAAFIALTELGSLFGGAVFVSGKGQAMARRGRADGELIGFQAGAQPLITSSLDHGDDRVNQVRAFFENACEQRHGAALKVTRAWDAFLEWCEVTKQLPRIEKQHFAMIASGSLKMPRKKMTTVDGNGIYYLNLALKGPRASRIGNIIQLTRVAAAGHA